MAHGACVRCLRVVSLLPALFALNSCADLTGPKGLSQSEANVLATQLIGGLAHGANNASVTVAGDVAPISKILLNIPINNSVGCEVGGTMHLTGSVTGSVNDQTGFGTVSIGMTLTITDWKCDGNLVVNGDPYLSAAGTISMPSGDSQMSLGGGIKWTGDGAGSCTMQLTILTYANGSGHASGQICGQQVNVSD